MKLLRLTYALFVSLQFFRCCFIKLCMNKSNSSTGNRIENETKTELTDALDFGSNNKRASVCYIGGARRRHAKLHFPLRVLLKIIIYSSNNICNCFVDLYKNIDRGVLLKNQNKAQNKKQNNTKSQHHQIRFCQRAKDRDLCRL